MNDRLKDFAQCSKLAFANTFSKLKKSYILFLFILVQAIFESIKSTGFLGGSYITGIILYLIDVVIYCFIAQSLRSLVLYGNSGKKSVDSSVSNFFYLSINAMFSVYIINLFVDILTRGLTGNLNFVLAILMRFLLSAVLEYVYIQQYYGFDIVIQSAKFVLNNILIWGVYSIVYVILSALLLRSLGSYGLSTGMEILEILALTVFNTFFYLFKGHLFKLLTSHSYRQRKFMRGYDD
ncbi:MAG: hypothetical protein SOW41_02700 [Anaerococcus sp.]|jgi:hypothetical protein|nr:hypothetical protein [Peptoniphilaceae bacterium]MDY3054952.1 hypothetical protein [Anaerococcus sp.]